MKEFFLGSKYLDNIRRIVSKFPAIKEQKCTISINKQINIELPVVVASSISTKITQTLENDPTVFKFPITINNTDDSESNSNETSIEKIKRVVETGEKVEIENEEDIYNFAKFGLDIGNEDFVIPLQEKLAAESANITEDNIVNILKMKKTFNIHEMEKETSFISRNFESMSKREDFISFSKNKSNIDIIRNIIESDSLHMQNEDILLSFLLTICKSYINNDESRKEYFRLFEHLYLEYCSVSKCEEFLAFVKQIIETQSIHSLLTCIGRRLLQPEIPLKQSFIKGRHNDCFVEITADDSLNGIFIRENKKGNVLLETVSEQNIGIGNVFDVLSDNNDTFGTINVQNSFIKASLKDMKPFVINKYTIKAGDYDRYLPKSWKLEGQKASNSEWVLLDTHSEEPFSRLQVKKFDISFKEKLKAVKLTQEGKNTHGDYDFRVSLFDVFGLLYEKE